MKDPLRTIYDIPHPPTLLYGGEEIAPKKDYHYCGVIRMNQEGLKAFQRALMFMSKNWLHTRGMQFDFVEINLNDGWLSHVTKHLVASTWLSLTHSGVSLHVKLHGTASLIEINLPGFLDAIRKRINRKSTK